MPTRRHLHDAHTSVRLTVTGPTRTFPEKLSVHSPGGTHTRRDRLNSEFALANRNGDTGATSREGFAPPSIYWSMRVDPGLDGHT